jgi:hypothetical protein
VSAVSQPAKTSADQLFKATQQSSASIDKQASLPLNKKTQESTAVTTGTSRSVSSTKKAVTKNSKKSKKIVSPEIVPSEWDTSSEEETKSDKPKPTSSSAPRLKKSSTNSEFVKNKDILKAISIKKSTHGNTVSTGPISQKISIDQGQENNHLDQSKEVPAVPSFPQISSDSAVQKKIENYFVPQGRTNRSISSVSSILPSASFTTEPYEPADSSDLDIITG